MWSSLFVSCTNHPGGDLNLILRDAITLDFFGSLYPLWDIVPCNLQLLMEWNIHCDLAPPPSKRDYSWIVVEMMTVLLEGLQFVWHNNRHHHLREMKMPRSTNVGSIIRGRQQYWSWWGWSLHKPLLLCIYPPTSSVFCHGRVMFVVVTVAANATVFILPPLWSMWLLCVLSVVIVNIWCHVVSPMPLPSSLSLSELPLPHPSTSHRLVSVLCGTLFYVTVTFGLPAKNAMFSHENPPWFFL